MTHTNIETTASNEQGSARMLSFKNYMAPLNELDSLDEFCLAMSENGLEALDGPSEIFPFENEADALACAHELAVNMQEWGRWLEAKVQGYQSLRDLGAEEIRRSADVSGVVSVNEDEIRVSGEFCQLGKVVYVFYNGEFETSAATMTNDKALNKRMNRGTAKYLLETMYENSRVSTSE